MKTFKTIILPLLVISLLAGCKGNKAKSMAHQLCDCGSQKDMADQMNDGKYEKFMDCMGGREVVMKIGDGMTDDEKIIFWDALDSTLNKTCPEVSELITDILPKKKESKAEKMAKQMCDCSGEMMALMKRMKDDPVAADGMMAEAQESQKKFMDCMGGEDALKRMDGGMNEDEKKRLETEMIEALNKRCPEVAKEMGMGNDVDNTSSASSANESNDGGGMKNYSIRFFSVNLPSSFVMSKMYDDNSPDFCDYTVKTSDGLQILELHSLTSGRFGEGTILELYTAALKGSKLNIVYKTQSDNWFVISGTDPKNGNIVYWKRVLGSNFVSDLSIEYPASRKSEIEPYIGDIAKSFMGN